MDKILKNMKERAIARAIQANFISFRLLFSRLPTAEIFKDSGFLWIDSGTFRASWNGILELKVPHDSYPFQHYLGYIDNKPVASSVLFLNSGVAGIYFVGTIAQLRGKGIGSAMTAFSMLSAKELGYRVAVLRASEMGKGVYRRLGFKDYFKFQRYLSEDLKKVN